MDAKQGSAPLCLRVGMADCGNSRLAKFQFEPREYTVWRGGQASFNNFMIQLTTGFLFLLVSLVV